MIRTLLLFAATSGVSLAHASGGPTLETGTSGCPMAAQQTATAALDAVQRSAGDKIDLAVTGLTCGSCADKVTAALHALEGVEAAFVDLTTGTAKVAFDGDKTNLDALVAAISGAGEYTASKKAAARN